MQQSQFDGIATFIAVTEEKSFSAAAAKLGVSPSAVSQTIRNLERRLGVTLFSRNTRSVGMTEAGELYLDRVLPAVGALQLASEELQARSSKPTGNLRINLARSGYMTILQPLLRRFLAQYPEVSMEICIDGTLSDIVGRGFDAGIRFGNLVQKDMVAVLVGPPIVANILASPRYLERYGTPQHPRDLINHDCIGFRHLSSGQIERWAFEKDGEKFELATNGRLIVNDSDVLVKCALDGLGVAYMINGFVESLISAGRLIRLLPEWSPSLPGFTLYYPNRKSVAPKLRAFIDFFRASRDRSSTSYP